MFWLHHANIDRMWNRWLAQGGGRTDASDAAWRNAEFTFYDEAGHAVYLTGAEIVDTVGQLNYRYDDDPLTLRRRFALPIATGPLAEARPSAVAAAPETTRPETSAATVPGGEALRTLAASAPTAHRIELSGTTQRVQVPVTEAGSNRMRELVASNAPRQIILRFDDIQYKTSNGVYYEVYIDPPAGQKLDIHSPGYVGNLALFGLKPHALAGHHPPLATDVFVEYNISYLVREALAGNPKELTVVLVPRGLFNEKGEPLPVPAGVQGTVGSVRILGR